MNKAATQHPIEARASAAHPLGMPAARFLRDYWQKQPLLIRAAAVAFHHPLAPEDLAGLACEELALSRIVIRDERRDRWIVRNGPFAEGDFASLPKTGWTVLVQDVDKWDDDVAMLLESFDFLPSWRIDDVMVSYAEEGGSVGAHVDQYDVFLRQGLGLRRWQISTDADAPRAFRDDTDLKLLRQFTPTHEWTLQAGDMLYLPPGVPHHGIAVGGPCMTYSIGMRAPSQADLAGDFIDHLVEGLPEEFRYTDASLTPSRYTGEIDAAALARVAESMPWLSVSKRTAPASGSAARTGRAGNAVMKAGGAVDASLLRDWFGRFITRYRSAQDVTAGGPPIGDAAFARALARDAVVQRNPWSRFAWTRVRRGAILFVSGDAHACSVRFAETVNRHKTFAMASASTLDRDHGVLRGLIDAGHLAIQKAARRRRPT